MRNKMRTVLTVLGVLFLVAALGLTVYNFVEAHNADAAARHAIQGLSPLIDEERPAVIEQPSDVPEVEQPDYLLNPDKEMPVKVVDGEEYVGVLRIPKLGLELPVMSSWSYPKLKKAPCRYAGTAYLHNMVIAAHNYPQFFRNIDQLEPGDSVTFTDMDGNVFTYEVTGHEIIQPTEIDRMVNGDWDLTFFRCTYAARARYAVRCKLVS